MTEQALEGSPSDYLSYMTRYGTVVVVAAALGLVAWLGACSDSPCASCPPPPPPSGFIASDPIPSLSSTVSSSSGIARSPSVVDNNVYVSLLPGTVPAGRDATVHVVGSVTTVFASVVEGGFDPVPITADVGDSIEVVVTELGGAVVKRLGLAVSARRPPVVVRTEPPPKKRDHPLNAAIVVVFSEPISSPTLTTSSLQLFRGTTAVAGTVRLLQGTGAVAAFTPAAPLARNTDYRLVVTRAVRDLEGDALEAGMTLAFTTGQSSTGPAASITVSPDSVYMTGAVMQMTATVRDAPGNVLIDQPVTWSTSDPSGLTVTATGLVTALAAGEYSVTATVNGVSGAALIVVTAGPAASMTLSPTQATVGAAGDTIILTATVRDAAGRLLEYPSVTWTSSDVAVATVATVADAGAGPHGSAFAAVTGVSLGSVVITATSGPASATASIDVISPPPVASVTVSPASATVLVHATRQLFATLRDAKGRVLTGRSITWTTDNAGVATVDASGLVTGLSVGSAAVIGTSEGVSDTAAITVTALGFVSVSAGREHTCGLMPSGAAYCWGTASYGQLGIGSDTAPDQCVVPRSASRFPCSLTPVAVTGGLTFSGLSAGMYHTCGITTAAAAYCWGQNYVGQGGNGSTSSWSSGPVAVTGGLTFSGLSPGRGHTCGITVAGAAYCWGSNAYGELGIGSNIGPELCSDLACSTTPRAVAGGLTFAAASAGVAHTCGLATNGAAYCWGSNNVGQLGIGSNTGPEQCFGGCSTRPVAVAGGLTFATLTAGEVHTCGLTTAGVAYCWGSNGDGQLGNGTTTGPEMCGPSPCSTVPAAVSGGLAFSGLSAGGSNTCGITTAGVAYCWGYGYDGELGDGLTSSSPVPVAVSGGLTFSKLSVGVGHSCGVTVAGILYCWGGNQSGQLGNGTRTDSSVPVKVAGQP